MSLPALAALRAAHARDSLTVLARPWVAELYRLRAEVDDVLTEDPKGKHRGLAGKRALAEELRRRSFQKAVVLPRSFETALVPYLARIPERHGYRGELRSPLLTNAVPFHPRPGEHQVFQHLRLARAAGADPAGEPEISWPVPARLARGAEKLLAEAGWDGGPFAAAHVASFGHTAKRWGLARFAETFDLLAGSRGLSIVLLGSAAEAEMNREVEGLCRSARLVHLAGKTSLPDVLGVLDRADLFLGNDSGLAHLAGAVGIPTTVVFGSTDPEATRPWDGPRAGGAPSRVRVARERVLCAPCRSFVCPIDHRCMTGLSVGTVLAAVEASLA